MPRRSVWPLNFDSWHLYYYYCAISTFHRRRSCLSQPLLHSWEESHSVKHHCVKTPAALFSALKLTYRHTRAKRSPRSCREDKLSNIIRFTGPQRSLERRDPICCIGLSIQIAHNKNKATININKQLHFAMDIQRLFIPDNRNPEDQFYSYALRITFLITSILYLGVMLQLLPLSILRKLPGMGSMTAILLSVVLGMAYVRDVYGLD